mgnify:CR=1 FL=1
MVCPYLAKRGLTSVICKLTRSRPEQVSLCRGEFYRCPVYISAGRGPRILSIKQTEDLLEKLVTELDKYEKCLERLEQEYLKGTIDPLAYQTLKKRYTREIEGRMLILKNPFALFVLVLAANLALRVFA